MNRSILAAILAAILASLSCGQYVTPTPASIEAPAASATPTRTPPPPTPTPQAAATEQTAKVIAAAVNIRSKPNGEVVGQIFAGQSVTILSCDGDWCKIKHPLGYVWRGCLSVESGLLCQAKESE
jgi:SH3 domain-containing protein